jgi:hypothetical protein
MDPASNFSAPLEGAQQPRARGRGLRRATSSSPKLARADSGSKEVLPHTWAAAHTARPPERSRHSRAQGAWRIGTRARLMSLSNRAAVGGQHSLRDEPNGVRVMRSKRSGRRLRLTREVHGKIVKHLSAGAFKRHAAQAAEISEDSLLEAALGALFQRDVTTNAHRQRNSRSQRVLGAAVGCSPPRDRTFAHPTTGSGGRTRTYDQSVNSRSLYH